MKVGEQIEALYKSSFEGPFPYKDCRWLANELQKPIEDLIPELDLYFGDIAGYGSRATRLGRRSCEELKRAQEILSKDLYQRFPDLEAYRCLVNSEHTPELHSLMEVAEKLRLALLQFVPEILKEKR